jgi:hypothetical protein
MQVEIYHRKQPVSFSGLFVWIAVLFMITYFSSCHSTRIIESWRDPETMVSFEKLNKVLVTAFLKDETSRRIAEDQMAALLKGKGITSYSYFGEDIKSISETEVQQRLKKDAFDGAVVMRLVDVRNEIKYSPRDINTYPLYFRSFGGYYRRGWRYYSLPDRYDTTRAYSIETTVYSIKREKLIWSGVTETTDPPGVDKLVTETSNRIYKKMMKEGFITE